MTVAAPGLIDAYEQTERALGDAIGRCLTDGHTIEALAGAWRMSLASAAVVPPKWRRVGELGALSRGDGPGGLGADYPSGLAAATRAGWVSAARALAVQQAWTPFGTTQAFEMDRLAQALEGCPAPAFAPTPSRTVLEVDGFRLRRIRPEAETRGVPVLVVASLINRWYVLDFFQDHSFLDMLSGLGRPVYLLEGLAPQPGDERGLQELCAGPLRDAVDHLRQLHDEPAVSLIGYCLGGTLSAMLAARYPERVARLATICGPVRFSAGGLFTRWLAAEHLDVDVVAAAHDPVPAWLVHLPFWWLRPTIKLGKLVRLARCFDQPGFLTRFMASEVWNHDNVDMARGVFRSWVGSLYQRDDLVQGRLIVDGEPVSLARSSAPLLVVSAAYDTITPPAAVEALLEETSCASPRRLQLRTSHVGVLTSQRSLAALQGELTTWLDQSPGGER